MRKVWLRNIKQPYQDLTWANDLFQLHLIINLYSSSTIEIGKWACYLTYKMQNCFFLRTIFLKLVTKLSNKIHSLPPVAHFSWTVVSELLINSTQDYLAPTGHSLHQVLKIHTATETMLGVCSQVGDGLVEEEGSKDTHGHCNWAQCWRGELHRVIRAHTGGLDLVRKLWALPGEPHWVKDE